MNSSNDNEIKYLFCIGGYFMLESIINPESDSSSEDDEVEFAACLIKRKPVRIEGYVERVIPNYLNEEFRQHFRLKIEVFECLMQKVAPHLQSERQQRIPAEKQVLAVLWLLATPDSYRSVGDRFNLAKSSLSHVFVRVVNSLNAIAPITIRWPNRSEKHFAKQKFKELSGLDGIIGAIDGSYVRINAPADQYESYTNRKMFQSITLQAVCDSELKFIDCFAGFPSSVHDARIFRNSTLFENVESNKADYFNNDEVLLGDKAYPPLSWLIPPHLNRGRLTQQQKKFNKKHANARQVIERSFALLFGRFRRLHDLDMNRIDWIPATILACCVLHNMCIGTESENEFQEYIDEGIVEVSDDVSEDHDVSGELLRQQMTEMC